MIFCTKCQSQFSEDIEANNNRLICVNCKFEIPVQDNLVVFHPEDSGSHDGIKPCIYDDVIDMEDKHFWLNARKKLIQLVFEKYVDCEDKIIEIGAGTGNVTGFLMKNGYKNISVGDVHLEALEYSKKYSVRHRYQFNIVKAPFKEHFDVVGMFDVLEHTDDELTIVQNVYKMLKKGGRVVVTVPAHMRLWSKEDAIPGHRRRYEVDQLKEIFENSGFKVLRASAFFASLLPLLYLRKVLCKDNGVIKDDDFKNRFHVNPIVNFVLGTILNLEVKLLSNVFLKYGGSIMLVGEKQSTF